MFCCIDVYLIPLRQSPNCTWSWVKPTPSNPPASAILHVCLDLRSGSCARIALYPVRQLPKTNLWERKAPYKRSSLHGYTSCNQGDDKAARNGEGRSVFPREVKNVITTGPAVWTLDESV